MAFPTSPVSYSQHPQSRPWASATSCSPVAVWLLCCLSPESLGWWQREWHYQACNGKPRNGRLPAGSMSGLCGEACVPKYRFLSPPYLVVASPPGARWGLGVQGAQSRPVMLACPLGTTAHIHLTISPGPPPAWPAAPGHLSPPQLIKYVCLEIWSWFPWTRAGSSIWTHCPLSLSTTWVLGTMATSQGWKRGDRRVKSVCFGWRSEPAPSLALSHVSWEESGFLEAHVTFQSRVPTRSVFSLAALHKVNGHHRRPQFPSYSHAGCAGAWALESKARQPSSNFGCNKTQFPQLSYKLVGKGHPQAFLLAHTLPTLSWRHISTGLPVLFTISLHWEGLRRPFSNVICAFFTNVSSSAHHTSLPSTVYSSPTAPALL